jgi:hypothetical protein
MVGDETPVWLDQMMQHAASLPIDKVEKRVCYEKGQLQNGIATQCNFK